MLDQYVRAGLLTRQPREGGGEFYSACFDPPASPEQQALRDELQALLPEEVDFSKKSLISLIDFVLDELC